LKPGATRKYKFSKNDVVDRWAKRNGEWRWPSVKRWLASLQTQGKRCQYLFLFCDWAKIEPPSLLDMKNNGSLEAEYLLDDFASLDGTADAPYPNSVMVNVVNAVRSYCRKNYQSLEPTAGAITLRKVRAYRKHTQEQLRRIFNVCLNPRDKSLVATCFSTALAKETLMEFRWSHFEDDWENQATPHISIPDTLLKGHGRGRWKGVEQHTFLTPEAKRCLLNYRDWMRNTRQVEFRREGHIYLALHEPFGNLTMNTLGMIHTRISERLPFKFSWHDGRRYVQTALEEAGLTRNWVQKIKGRRTRGEDAPYSLPEIEKLRTAFQKALPCLCFLETEALANRVEMDRVKLALGERTLREQALTREVEELKRKFALAHDGLEALEKPEVLEALLNQAKKKKRN